MIPKQIKFQDAVGKTVAAVGLYEDSLGIRYTDGTFSYVERFAGRGCSDYTLDDLFYSYEELLESVKVVGTKAFFTDVHEVLFLIGVLSKESILEELEPKMSKARAEIEQRERKQYEQLKAKYENRN